MIDPTFPPNDNAKTNNVTGAIHSCSPFLESSVPPAIPAIPAIPPSPTTPVNNTDNYNTLRNDTTDIHKIAVYTLDAIISDAISKL